MKPADALDEAETEFRSGRLLACLERLEPITFDDPAEQARAQALAGRAKLRLGDLEGAVDDLERALEFREEGPTLLQLAHALRYARRLEATAEPLARAEALARAAKDGALMLAVLCARGEGALAAGDASAALHLFGEARGLSELSGFSALSVLPLAGLAEAQARLGYPAKAERNALKALERAQAANDPLGEVRALLALGAATARDEVLAEAETLAFALPHRPLADLARRRRQERAK